jgi:Zn-dependent protease with chaperone function
MKTRYHLLAWVAIIAVLSTACQSVQTTKPGAVGVERKQSMSSMVSASAIEQTAARAYDAEVGNARAHSALNVDAAQTVRIRKIAARLIDQTNTFRPDAKDWKWAINVQASNDLNAYCMPGGRIMVYTGLVDKLALTDAEIATVLAHEIAHALREHSREHVSRAYAQAPSQRSPG